MGTIRGLSIAFGLFAGSFALHIVAGASGLGWLFAIAVALIYVTATGFPVIAIVAGGFPDLDHPGARFTGAVGAAAGYVFTVGALWAANGRAFAWWEFPAAFALVILSSAMILLAWRARMGSRANGRPRRSALVARD